MSQHSKPQPPHSDMPQPPEPTFAERARTLMHIAPVGTLCTISRKHLHWPFGSVVAYGLDEKGNPSLLISTMAMHTQNILADPRASLFVMQPGGEDDPLGAARVTVMGRLSKIPRGEDAFVRQPYLDRHPQASYWADFQDFSFFVMQIIDVYFVGGFGAMDWISPEEYAAAQVDPLADAGPGLIAYLNAHHQDALLLLARISGHPDANEATLTAIDRLGVHLRITTKDRVTGIRLAFPEELKDPEDAKPIFVKMVQEAKEKATP